MKNFLIGLFTFIGTTGISAQTQSITVHSQTTGKEEIIDVPESMQSEMDSLYWDWQSKNHITLGENCTMASTNPVVSDSIYMDRLSRIPSIIEMPYNEAVRKFIDMYAVRLRNKVSFMLAATNFYMPIFEEALDLYDLPQELKYLPIIESALNPVAVSRQGATGFICPMETQLPNATDTIHINKDLHLQQVAEVCNINLDQLRSLNPQYKKDIIPGNSELCALRLPNNFVSTFIDRQDSVFAYKPNEYLTKRKTVAIKETTSSRNRSSKGTLYHKIKQGDTLGGIAAKYHVSISQLRNLNGIKGNNIRAGRSLRIR